MSFVLNEFNMSAPSYLLTGYVPKRSILPLHDRESLRWQIVDSKHLSSVVNEFFVTCLSHILGSFDR